MQLGKILFRIRVFPNVVVFGLDNFETETKKTKTMKS